MSPSCNPHLQYAGTPVLIHLRTLQSAKPARKRLHCKVCDGKICVGRCKFEKVN